MFINNLDVQKHQKMFEYVNIALFSRVNMGHPSHEAQRLVFQSAVAGSRILFRDFRFCARGRRKCGHSPRCCRRKLQRKSSAQTLEATEIQSETYLITDAKPRPLFDRDGDCRFRSCRRSCSNSSLAEPLHSHSCCAYLFGLQRRPASTQMLFYSWLQCEQLSQQPLSR